MIKYSSYLLLLMVLLVMPSSQTCSAQAFINADSRAEALFLDDKEQFCDNQFFTFEPLASNVLLYQQATGVFPESMYEFVQSGFPIFWPMNISRGNAAYVVDDLMEPPNEGMLGAFKFSITDYGFAQLDFVNYDCDLLKDSNDVILVVSRFEIFATQSEADSSFDPDADKFNTRKVSNFDSHSPVKALNEIAEIDDYNNRVITAFCLQMSNYVCLKMQEYIFLTHSYPASFSELINETGSSELIILENLDYFVELLQDADAKFLLGYDSTVSTMYVYLEIDDETFIAHFENLDETTSDITLKEYSIDDFDVENAILSTDNLSEIELPYDYVVSIYDVPAGI